MKYRSTMTNQTDKVVVDFSRHQKFLLRSFATWIEMRVRLFRFEKSIDKSIRDFAGRLSSSWEEPATKSDEGKLSWEEEDEILYMEGSLGYSPLDLFHLYLKENQIEIRNKGDEAFKFFTLVLQERSFAKLGLVGEPDNEGGSVVYANYQSNYGYSLEEEPTFWRCSIAELYQQCEDFGLWIEN